MIIANPMHSGVVGRMVARLASRLGYEVIAKWRRPGLEMAEHLRALLDRLGTTCVLDVGANEGQYCKFLRNEVGYEGLVVSFEPIPDLARALQGRAATTDRWIVLPHALGSANGTARLNVMRSTQLSSFLSPDSTFVPEVREDNVVDRVVEVDVRRLDSVLASLRREHDLSSVYLKVDTQGFDLEVINGLGEEISAVEALQVEIALRPIYRGMPGFAEALSTLRDLGFEISGLFPVSHDRRMRLVELDCVMVSASSRKLGATDRP